MKKEYFLITAREDDYIRLRKVKGFVNRKLNVGIRKYDKVYSITDLSNGTLIGSDFKTIKEAYAEVPKIYDNIYANYKDKYDKMTATFNILLKQPTHLIKKDDFTNLEKETIENNCIPKEYNDYIHILDSIEAKEE